jgi:hypothetical protein
MWKTARYFLIFIFFAPVAFASPAASPSNITYEGVLTDTGGATVNLSGLPVKFSIVNVADCVIYQETSSLAGDTVGTVSHQVGSGTPIFGSFDVSLFNSGKTGSGGCAVDSTESRYLAIEIASLAVLAKIPITSVPYALESSAVGGFSASALLRTDATVTGGTTALNNTQYNQLISLLGASPSFSVQPQFSGTPSAAADLTNKTYVDAAISSSISSALPNVGTAGTYFQVTTDAKGRVTSGVAALAQADIPTLTTAGKVSGDALTSGTIAGSTAISTSGILATSASVKLFNGSNYVQLQAPTTLASNLTFKFPDSAGSSGQVLSTNGSGQTAWITPTVSAGNVTGTVAVTNGGTGLSSLALGDLLFASAANTLSALPKGPAGTILTTDGTSPLWGTKNAMGLILNGGNDLSAAVTIGTNDLNPLYLETNNTRVVTVDPNGSVGIGVSGSPNATFQVNGTITGKPATAPLAGSTVDFSSGNLQYTSSNCGAFTLNNMKNGATYTLIVKGTGGTLCSFPNAWSGPGSGTALTVHMPPDHGNSISTTHTMYNFAVVGDDVYVGWTPGY